MAERCKIERTPKNVRAIGTNGSDATRVVDYSLLLNKAIREAEKAIQEAEKAKMEADKAKMEAELEHQKTIKLCEEIRRKTDRIRIAAKRENPVGTIEGIVKTEWGTFFNIKQSPS